METKLKNQLKGILPKMARLQVAYEATLQYDETRWTEARIQSECVELFNFLLPEQRGLLFTVNNNSSDGVKGAQQTALGRIAGVSDLIYLQAGNAHFIEMKTETGLQSQNQLRWQVQVQEEGFSYCVCHSSADFMRLMIQLYATYATNPTL